MMLFTQAGWRLLQLTIDNLPSWIADMSDQSQRHPSLLFGDLPRHGNWRNAVVNNSSQLPPSLLTKMFYHL